MMSLLIVLLLLLLVIVDPWDEISDEGESEAGLVVNWIIVDDAGGSVGKGERTKDWVVVGRE